MDHNRRRTDLGQGNRATTWMLLGFALLINLVVILAIIEAADKASR